MKSPLVPIFLTVFVDVLGLTLVLPLLPHYAKHFGADPFVIGLLISSYAACQLVAGPILGRISDRVGRKPTLIVSQLGTCVGFLVMGLATRIEMLFLGRIIDGFTAGNLSIAQAYISDVTKPENRTKAFGIIGIAFGMGFLIGPFISGQLADHYGYSAPVFGAAGLSFLSMLATTFLLPRVPPVPEGQVPESTRRGEARTSTFRRFFQLEAPRRRLLEFFCFTLSFSTLMSGLTMYLDFRHHYGPADAGYVFAFSGLIGALIQGGLLGRIVKKVGEEKLAAAGFAAMAVGYGLLGLAFDLPFLLVLVAISGFGIAVTRPCLTTMLTKSVRRSEQGAALGVSQSLQSISQIVGGLAAGSLIKRQWLGSWGILAASFAVAGFLMRLRPEPSATSDVGASA